MKTLHLYPNIRTLLPGRMSPQRRGPSLWSSIPALLTGIHMSLTTAHRLTSMVLAILAPTRKARDSAQVSIRYPFTMPPATRYSQKQKAPPKGNTFVPHCLNHGLSNTRCNTSSTVSAWTRKPGRTGLLAR